MELGLDDMKMFIYNKLTNLEVNSFLLNDYVINNDVKYTENKNGIFLNLNSLNNKQVNDIYNIINNKIKYNDMISNIQYKISIDEKNINCVEIETKDVKIYNKLNEDMFSDIELELIKLSLIK